MNNFTFPLEGQRFRIQNCQTPQILADQLAKLCIANGFEYYQLCLTLRRGLQQTDLTLLGLVDVYCWIFVQNNWGNNLLSRSL